MAKKKKSLEKIPHEIRERAEAAAADLLGRLPADDPAAEFARAGEGLADHEAALIETLAESRSAPALNFLHQLVPVLRDKSLAKAAKRAIYRLEQEGLEASPEAKSKAAAIFQKPPKRRPVGYLSTYDSYWARFVLLALPSRLVGFNAAMCICSQREGLDEFKILYMTGRDLKQTLMNYETSPYNLTEVPPEHVRFVLAEAAVRTLDLGRPLPDGYAAFISMAGDAPLPERPPVYEKMPEDEEAGGDMASMVQELLAHPLLETFVLVGDLEPYIDKLIELERSVLVLSDFQKEERCQAIYDQAADEIFDRERRADLKRCLEEIALLFWQTQEPALTAAAVAAARDVDPEEGAARPLFIRAMVRYSLELEEPPEDEPRDGYGRASTFVSESGLILPGDFGDPTRR